jgi:MFS family permease
VAELMAQPDPFWLSRVLGKIATGIQWCLRQAFHHGPLTDDAKELTKGRPKPPDQHIESQRQCFKWFLAGVFTSAIGRNGYQIACAWILVAKGLGSPAVAAFFAIISVTELLASPLAGWLSDHWDRRLQYIIADGIRLIAILALGTALIVPDLRWTIWSSAVVFAMCDRIALTTSQSMIPSIAMRLSPSTGNSIVFFLMQSGSFIAAVLTGVLLQLSTPTHTLAVLAVAFGLSVGCMLRVRQESVAHQSDILVSRQKLVINAQLVQLGAIYALLYTGGVLVSVIGPSFVFEERGGSAIDFGQLESAWSAGSIVGTLLLIPLIRAVKISLLQFFILGMTAASFAILKEVDISWSLLVFAMLGTLYNLGRVAVEVTLQSCVPGAALGRAKGVLHSVGVLFGVALFGAVAIAGDQINPSSVFLTYSGVLAAGALVLGTWHVAGKR